MVEAWWVWWVWWVWCHKVTCGVMYGLSHEQQGQSGQVKHG